MTLILCWYSSGWGILGLNCLHNKTIKLKDALLIFLLSPLYVFSWLILILLYFMENIVYGRANHNNLGERE
jgi:hypothetical protein